MTGILVPEFQQGRWVTRGRLAVSPLNTYAFGRWGRLACMRPFTVTVAGVTGPLISTVQLYVSNSLVEPPPIVAPTVVGASALGPSITQAQTLTYDFPFEWIGAVILNNSGATQVDLAAG